MLLPTAISPAPLMDLGGGESKRSQFYSLFSFLFRFIYFYGCFVCMCIGVLCVQKAEGFVQRYLNSQDGWVGTARILITWKVAGLVSMPV